MEQELDFLKRRFTPGAYEDAQELVRTALCFHPTLDQNGLNYPKPSSYGRPDLFGLDQPEAYFQVALCACWLDTLPKLAKGPSRTVHSYSWKHVVEHYFRRIYPYPEENSGLFYVSNGAFIATCLARGLSYYRRKDDSLNVFLSIPTSEARKEYDTRRRADEQKLKEGRVVSRARMRAWKLELRTKTPHLG